MQSIRRNGPTFLLVHHMLNAGSLSARCSRPPEIVLFVLLDGAGLLWQGSHGRTGLVWNRMWATSTLIRFRWEHV